MKVTLDQLAEIFSGAGQKLKAKLPETVSMIGDDIAARARGKLGEYRGEAAPFHSWQSLADSTIDNRVKLGYAADEPGLREGDMRRSIRTNVTSSGDTATAHVGSDMDTAKFFEEGTINQPPRSFLGSSAVEGTTDALKRVTDAVEKAFK
jgi:hypothetical protein